MNCRVCGCNDMCFIKKKNYIDELSVDDFKISDARYGVMGDLYLCSKCTYMQCENIPELLNFYTNLQDEAYESGRKHRLRQMRDILRYIRGKCGFLPYDAATLDVGAGSGILVEAALQLGMRAEGIEPGKWLCEASWKKHLPIHCLTLDMFKPKRKYDLITIIDVIEHVENAVDIMSMCRELLHDDGILIAVTPNRSSLAARLLGWKWWHYRIAHIGYFNIKSLDVLLARAGLKRIDVSHPG